jgi:hypothetical protein
VGPSGLLRSSKSLQTILSAPLHPGYTRSNRVRRQNKFRIPPQYIVLDTLGSVMVGLGIYGLIIEEAPPALALLNLKRDAWEFIIGGLILMLPMIAFVIRKLRMENFGSDE